MEELTESARQCLVSQGIILGALTVLNSLCLLITGIVVMTRATDILHFTSLTHLAILEIICGVLSCSTIIYIWWIVAAYRNRQLEVRSKYLDEHMSRALLAVFFPLMLTFAALVVSAVFLTLKVETSSTYDLKAAMTLYSTDITRKVIIDKLQILLECCGSLSLLDWFLIDWQNSDLEPGVHLQNKTLSDWDSVPYSCCCQEAPPPCIHHQLKTFGVGSVYTTGCADKLDSVVFNFVLMALIMFFVSTFLTTILSYTCRKLQTSARSAVLKGDATAPGHWWLLSAQSIPKCQNEEILLPLLGTRYKTPFPRFYGLKGFRLSEASDSTAFQCYKATTEKKTFHCFNKEPEIETCYFDQNRSSVSPLLPRKKQKQKEYVNRRELESSKISSRNQYAECSEDWTRMANDPSGSTSSTFLMTSTRVSNSTPETRHSVSDTAVANLEVSHHFEHKVRPLYRT